jgi:SpoU rRNA methylase family enzyme
MLSFAADAQKFTNITFSILNILSPQRTENCKKIAENFGVPLLIR